MKKFYYFIFRVGEANIPTLSELDQVAPKNKLKYTGWESGYNFYAGQFTDEEILYLKLRCYACYMVLVNGCLKSKSRIIAELNLI